MTAVHRDNSAVGQFDLRRPDFIYSLALFAIALTTLVFVTQRTGFLTNSFGPGSALFFLVYGFFTITMGYPHPGFGHVSFDRAAQVASILVLGPVDAAWINGLASLLYPWHRLSKGVPFNAVITASLHNAGMMSLVILSCGSLYAYLGGPVPIDHLSIAVAGLLLLLMLSMQLLNDLGMLVVLYLRKDDPAKLLSVFSTGVELASVLIAVVVAIAYVRLEPAAVGLLLVVLSLGMFVLKRYAEMRQKLEALVDERTAELKQKSQELEKQATHDKLTGLFNRRYADDYLQRQIESAKRYNRNFTIALADIDHFKQINDRFSHAIGDEVLCRVAQILVNRCRKTDVVARYGGEEFLLCFPDTNAEFAEQICGQIRTAVAKADWSPIAEKIGGHINITISFGIAETGNDTRRTTILSAADTRLYQAKRKGRNLVVVE
ncbi:MAG: GGDEF domain-containing protein [Woeseiaceae bacterium]